MDKYFGNLSIRSRLIVMLIAITMVTSLVLGLVGWQTGRSALKQTIFNQLNGIRAAQGYQVEYYFDQVFAHTRTLATDRMVTNAMNQMRQGYNNGLNQSLDEEQDLAVSTFYDEEFVPKIASSTTNTPLSILYQPSRAAARYFQYHYLVNNPYPIGSKDVLVESKGDTTIYNRFHKFYHPIFRDLLNEFNYYDIFLIDIESLSVVYSVYKEVDFATSLKDGPFRESSLGLLANQIKANPERNRTSILDYRSYAPSYGAPASFVGAPIFDRNEAIGIIAIQLPTDELNKVMTSDGRWRENGLGETGESYLVGSDKLMRSSSRYFLENEDEYFAEIEKNGQSKNSIESIKTFNTTVLLQPVASDSIDEVFEDETGTHLTNNYLGKRVLSTYAPLEIEGLDWAIVSEMDELEAFKEIVSLQRNILLWGLGLVLAVAFLSILLSRIFVRPIEKLSAGVVALRSGDMDAEINIDNNDEFGDLASQFNDMAESLRDQTLTIDEKILENERLIANVLPGHVAEKFRRSEQTAEQHQQASVLQLELDGFSEISNLFGAEEAAYKLHELLDQFENAAERYDVQSVSSAGTAYIAVSGLRGARLDHAKCVVDFSLTAIKAVLNFNEKHQTHISARIGIDSGMVNSAVIGSKRFKFGLWGDVVDAARASRSIAHPNSILVTQNVYDRVNQFYKFDKQHALESGALTIQIFRLVVNSQTTTQATEDSVATVESVT